MMNVKFGKEEYLERMLKIFEEVEKFDFETYGSFRLFLKMVVLHKQFS